MEKDKHTEVEDILNSINGIGRATPSGKLFDKIALKTTARKAVKIISLPAVSVAAAGILLLIAVNIAVLKNSSGTGDMQADPLKEVVNYYDINGNAFGL